MFYVNHGYWSFLLILILVTANNHNSPKWYTPEQHPLTCCDI
uniref:Uncharacterized protein n=1 Tax=Vibrio tasmaniensis TaxID=212663 RepID=A0A0H3ZR77_9VIBR|nr:hypothetical protein [Vibrio tasmaniensis]